MAEFVVGHEFIREPSAPLKTGEVVQFHCHNHHHNTHVTMGVVEIARRLKVRDLNGEHTGWQDLPTLRIAGGGPRTVVPVPADMEHKLTVIEGPAFYRCCFIHRDDDGKPTEEFHGYEEAYR